MPPYKAMPRIKGASIFFCHSRDITLCGNPVLFFTQRKGRAYTCSTFPFVWAKERVKKQERRRKKEEEHRPQRERQIRDPATARRMTRRGRMTTHRTATRRMTSRGRTTGRGPPRRMTGGGPGRLRIGWLRAG